MQINLQEVIDHGMALSTIELPIGEFEGPFYVRKPCTLVGSSTTLWRKKGPVLVIESTGVKVGYLRVETIEAEAGSAEYDCLVSKVRDTEFQNVEIIGNVRGAGNEDKPWKMPQVLSLGEFPAGKPAIFLMDIDIPVTAELAVGIYGVNAEPAELKPGRNRVTLTVAPCKHGTFLYGELAIVSQFVHKIYLNGLSNENIENYQDQCLIYTPEQASHQGNILSQNLLLSRSMTASPPVAIAPVINVTKAGGLLAVAELMPAEAVTLRRGERVAISEKLGNQLTLQLTYTERNEPLDIDPYVFLLDGANKTRRDQDLIFFSNPQSLCGGVHYLEQRKAMQLDLSKIPENIERISLSYAIYGDRPNDNFSKLQEASVQIKCVGIEKMRFTLTDLTIERTIVAIEFYRHQGNWKINAIGAGYKDGLTRLCQSYGLEILE